MGLDLIYTLNTLIFTMWDYFCFVLFSGDMALQEASDRAVKSRSLDVTYSRGYVATSI